MSSSGSGAPPDDFHSRAALDSASPGAGARHGAGARTRARAVVRPCLSFSSGAVPAHQRCRPGISTETNGMSKTETGAPPKAGTGTLELKDNRTGKGYSLQVTEEGVEGDTYIRGAELRNVKKDESDFGVLSYDPAFMNTASCKSAITFIDGDKGILRYRGYPIEQLAEKASFLEVAWLLRHGELPEQNEYQQWVHDITYHTYVHENIKTFLQGFRYDAHPMSMLCSAVAALSSFYPEAKNINDPEQRNIAIIRLIAKMPT